jgi:signal transduction histidine kinase
MAKLRPRARIIRTIGDQLISGPEAALIELVKNAYDADSPFVHITIAPPVDGIWLGDCGLITVIDHGHGMTAADITDKWFEPATSDKLDRRRSPSKNRHMLGAKGVGRFATARLGRFLDLKTSAVTTEGRLEISHIKVDWSHFEKSRYLDEVDIEVVTTLGEITEQTGVSLAISGLRDQWTKKQLELLVRELRRMISPVEAREDEFRIFLDLKGFQEALHGFDGQSIINGMVIDQGSVQNQVDHLADLEIKPFAFSEIGHYRVSGTFNDEGGFRGAFINYRGDGKSQEISLDSLPLEDDEANCGPFDLTLNIYDREGDAVVELFEKLGLGAVGKLEAKRVLDENIGIGIYRNGFRIRPYGDAETDWLELESMRVQNPSRKLGLNQVWGIVEISDERVSGLVERSSREGLEHNGSFLRLKRLMTTLLAQVESHRYVFRQSAGLSRKNRIDTEEVKEKANMEATERAVALLPPQYREKVEKALKQDRTAIKTSIAELETYQQALVSISTLGMVVAQILHDGRRFLSDINTRSRRLTEGASRVLEDSKFGVLFRSSFGKEAESILSSSTQLTKLFQSLDPISGKKRGAPEDFDVVKVIRKSLRLFTDAFQASSVDVNLYTPKSDSLMAHGLEADLLPALINIIDNAVYWLSTSTKARVLTIRCDQSIGAYIRIEISNNGPLIDERFREKLFSPGFSLKTQGSGIGLAIARESLRLSKGDLALDTEAEETTFVIEMLKARG